MMDRDFGKPSEADIAFHARINDRGDQQPSRLAAARRGSRVGWDSPEARRMRTAQHDLNSGRMTTDAMKLMSPLLSTEGIDKLGDFAWKYARQSGFDDSEEGFYVRFGERHGFLKPAEQVMQPGVEYTDPAQPIQ